MRQAIYIPPASTTGRKYLQMPPTKTARKTTKKTAKRRPAKKATRRTQKRPGRRAPSQTHIASMQDGRAMNNIIDQFVAAAAMRKSYGKAPSQNKLDTLRERCDAARGAKRIQLIQQVADYERRMDEYENGSGNYDELEAAFIGVAKTFGERHHITYASWRKGGVPVSTLRKAGIAVSTRR